MTEISISAEQLASARNFLVQFLRDSGYEGSVDDGTAIHDMVIKPMSLLMTVLKDPAEKARAYLSVKEAQAMKSQLGAEYDDVIDSILSNWFVSRREGIRPSIHVTLYFSKAPMVLRLDTVSTIAQAQGMDFKVTQPITRVETDFVAHVNPLGGTTRYSTEVFLTATLPGVLTQDVITSPPTFKVAHKNFIYGEVKGVVEHGTSKEDSEEFIQRTQQSITTRELISDRAIKTVLQDSVSSVRDVFVAGHGAPEQIRDLHTFSGVTLHTGNKSDIYVKTFIDRVTQNKLVQVGSLVDMTGSGILRVYSVKDTLGSTLAFTVTGSSESQVNSFECPWILSIPGASEGDIVVVEFTRASPLALADAYLHRQDNRVGCFDPLVKEMYPIHVHCDLNVRFSYSGVLDKGVDALILEVRDAAISYINSLGSADIFRVSSFISNLHTQVPELDQVETPVSCAYEILDPQDMTVKSAAISSRFTMPTTLSAQVTDNTTQYYTDVHSINVVHAG